MLQTCHTPRRRGTHSNPVCARTQVLSNGQGVELGGKKVYVIFDSGTTGVTISRELYAPSVPLALSFSLSLSLFLSSFFPPLSLRWTRSTTYGTTETLPTVSSL
jgi:hypothetical protein